MPNKIFLNEEKLREMYENDGMPQWKIAKSLGVSIDVVRRCMDEYNIERRIHKRLPKYKPIAFTEKQYDYLQGAMLGDGCLSNHKSGKGNSDFSYLSKSKQHCEFVAEPFSEILLKGGVVEKSYFDHRTNKTYQRCFFRTQMNVSFTKERMRWYRGNKKHIPKDLVLTPNICLIWYIGDGSLVNSKCCQEVKLATHCFEKEELETIIIPQMARFEARTNICGRSKNGDPQYGIFIPHSRVQDFIDYIGKCPFEDYKHKWEVLQYKNFSVKKNPEKIDRMVELFLNGHSSRSIAKKVGVDRTTVMKYLYIRGYDYKDNLHNKVRG